MIYNVFNIVKNNYDAKFILFYVTKTNISVTHTKKSVFMKEIPFV